MITVGQDEIAKYPFLADAGQYLKDKGFTLNQFGKDPDLRIILEKAFHRIMVSTDGKIYKSDIVNNISNDYALPKEVFSFLLAIVMLKLCGVTTLIKRFALSEARRAEKYLENDLNNSQDKTKEDLAIKIIENLFSVRIQKKDDFFIIPVKDYLKHSVKFYEREWKLVNRRVENGYVFLTSHESVRLIRQELGNYISEKILSTRTPEMISGFEYFVDKLREVGRQFTPTTTFSGKYPPCIKHAIEVLEKGENLPHSGRFMLATYFLGKGKSVQEISPFFKNAPDYNERVTLYQLNHLAGDNSGTKYACPSCNKLKSQNLCFQTPECDNIINPLQFGSRRLQ